MITAYHLLVFTDFIPNEQEYDEVRKGVGLSMVIFTAINVIVNTSIMMGKTYYKIRNSCRLLKYKINMLKLK